MEQTRAPTVSFDPSAYERGGEFYGMLPRGMTPRMHHHMHRERVPAIEARLRAEEIYPRDEDHPDNFLSISGIGPPEDGDSGDAHRARDHMNQRLTGRVRGWTYRHRESERERREEPREYETAEHPDRHRHRAARRQSGDDRGYEERGYLPPAEAIDRVERPARHRSPPPRSRALLEDYYRVIDLYGHVHDVSFHLTDFGWGTDHARQREGQDVANNTDLRMYRWSRRHMEHWPLAVAEAQAVTGIVLPGAIEPRNQEETDDCWRAARTWKDERRGCLWRGPYSRLTVLARPYREGR